MAKDFEFDLEDILAEFSDKAEQPDSKPTPAPAEARKPARAEPPSPQKKRPVRVRPVPVSHAGSIAEQKDAKPSPAPQAAEETTVFSYAGAKAPKVQPAAKKTPRKQARPPEKRTSKPEKQAKAPSAPKLPRSLTPVFVVLSLLCMVWLLFHVHPGSSVSALQTGEDLSVRLDLYMNNTISSALGDSANIPKLYAIPENATVAPEPDPSKFGSTTDVKQVQAVIDAAAGLLEGQSLSWDPDADFMPGAPFKYYLDDSLFVLAWKEIIDGKCCSCAEIKMVDGSQLRRKLAEDSYGSSLQLYATQLAREANAVVAINGDFYAFRNLGVTVYQRELYRCNPASIDTCFFTASGDMLFSYAGELKGEAAVKQFIQDHDVLFSVAFGPVLVDNGELKPVTSYPVGEIDHYYSRSSIGQLDTLHYLLMTVNYEGDYQHTCTTAQSGQYMLQKGCQKAYSLDGGQTSIIVFNGEAFNRVDWDNERSMSDLIYFATAVHKEETP